MDGFTISLIVVAYRILIPLTILRWPLAGIIFAMIADASDVMVLQATGWGVFSGGSDPYSYWDKSLDIWYLFIAWLVVRKHWTQPLARKTGHILFWWRVIGVATFFLWPHRIVFVFAPAIFENFYIIWTAIRKWWPSFMLNRRRLVYVLLGAAIPKLTQEFLMHWFFEGQTWHFFRTYVFWWLYQ